jgi:hypothetical protein
LKEYAFIFWYLLLIWIYSFILEILVLVFWVVCCAITALVLGDKGLAISILNVIVLFFSYWISSVFSGSTVDHVDRLFARWLEGLAHVGVAQLLELHGWFFLQTLSHASHSFVHLHLPAFGVVVGGNVWVVRISVASLSENWVIGVDLGSILPVHLGVVNELLARIAHSISQPNCYFLRALAYVFLINRQLLMEQWLWTSWVLLDEFEWVGLVVILEHDELVGILRFINIVYGVLEPVNKWLDGLTFDLFLITIQIALWNSVQ